MQYDKMLVGQVKICNDLLEAMGRKERLKLSDDKKGKYVVIGYDQRGNEVQAVGGTRNEMEAYLGGFTACASMFKDVRFFLSEEDLEKMGFTEVSQYYERIATENVHDPEVEGEAEKSSERVRGLFQAMDLEQQSDCLLYLFDRADKTSDIMYRSALACCITHLY